MLLCVLYILVHASTIFSLINYFISNFFAILYLFVPFLLFYFLIIVVFSRIFEKIAIMQSLPFNATGEDPVCGLLFKDFTESVYTTFRLSLNIVDISRSSADLMSMFVHLLFVLILPFMVFNYIIGVVTAELSSMVDFREEKAILFRCVILTLASALNGKLNIRQKGLRKTLLTVCITATDSCMCKKFRRELLMSVERRS